MNLEDITPLIITYNEAPNIARTLDRLAWAKRIVIVDSGSTDETIQIIGRWPNSNIIERRFDNFASQCNYGLKQIKSEWTLSMDADYVLEDGFVDELRSLDPQVLDCGYSASFIYRIYGRPLRGTLYTPRTLLYRTRRASYRGER